MSNYINSLSSAYTNRYNPLQATGPNAQYNDAPLQYDGGAVNAKASRVNDQGIQYLMQLQEKAKILSASLDDTANASTMQKMIATMPDFYWDDSAEAGHSEDVSADIGEGNAFGAEETSGLSGTVSFDTDYGLADAVSSATAASRSNGPTQFSQQGVQRLVDGYNSLLEVSRQGEEMGNSRLQLALEAASSAYSPQLTRLGVYTQEDGSLVINRTQLADSLEGDSAERRSTFYESALSGFQDRLSGIARSVMADPAYYINPTDGLQDNRQLDRLSDTRNEQALPILRNQQWYQLGFLIDLFV